MSHPEFRDPDYPAYARLFNDTATGTWVPLSAREEIAKHLWELGYRKPVQAEVTPYCESCEINHPLPLHYDGV